MNRLWHYLILIWGLLLIAFSAVSSAKEPYFAQGIEQIQQAMKEGRLSSGHLVQSALNLAEKYEPLNAFITLDEKRALLRARHLDAMREEGIFAGPLHGIPVAIKDNIFVTGIPGTAGSPAFAEFVPQSSASVVKRLEAAGAIILGKTNMHELAFGITSDNAFYGSVGNFYDGSFFAGGSSGGTAVAVAANITPVGLGTDTGGSSRIPAALNGVVGFRPTMGRYPSDGIIRISVTRDTVGPIARTVADIAIVDSVLSNDNYSLEAIDLGGLRLGVPRDYFYDNLETEVIIHTENLLQWLKAEGVELIEADLNDIADTNARVSFPVVLYETRKLLLEFAAQHLPESSIESVINGIKSPDVKEIVTSLFEEPIPEDVYLEAINDQRPKLQKTYSEYFSVHNADAIIFPTTPLVARPIKDSAISVELNNDKVPTFATYIRNTDPSSNAGIPGLSLPLAETRNGMPIGIEIDGPANSDQRLLAIGRAIELLIEKQNKVEK